MLQKNLSLPNRISQKVIFSLVTLCLLASGCVVTEDPTSNNNSSSTSSPTKVSKSKKFRTFNAPKDSSGRSVIAISSKIVELDLRPLKDLLNNRSVSKLELVNKFGDVELETENSLPYQDKVGFTEEKFPFSASVIFTDGTETQYDL